MPDSSLRHGYVTATGCGICNLALQGRADQQYCSPACRQTARRRRASTPALPPVPAGQRRQHTVYECDDCGQRLAGQQWCPDCQRPCRRIDLGGACPHCGEPTTITELIEAPMD